MSKAHDEPQPGSCRRWEVPTVGKESAATHKQVTVRSVEAVQKQAYEEGFELGRREGFALLRSQAEHLSKLMSNLGEPFADLDDQVVQELVALIKAIARRLVRREIHKDPGQIIAVVRDAVGVLPSASRNVTLHLHPDDVTLVREALAISDDSSALSLAPDPLLTRGDCRVITDTSRIDASLEARLNALVVAMLGGEREGDSREDS